jgi:hypothetical protein
LNNKWGFVEAGREIIPPQYDDETYFQNSLALVQLNKKWGAVDSTGKVLIPFQFDELSFTYLVDQPLNWYHAKLNGKWGFVNRKGIATIPLIYDAMKEYKMNASDNPLDTSTLSPMGDFVGKVEMVQLNGKWGAIYTKGKQSIPFKYEDILNESHPYVLTSGLNWFKVKLNNKWGLVDSLGNELIASRYPTALFRYDIDAIRRMAESKRRNVSENSTVTKTETKPEEAQNNAVSTVQNTGSKTESKPIVIPANLPRPYLPLNGKVDPDVVGLWAPSSGTAAYWRFLPDGTYEFYMGGLSPADKDPHKCYWRINSSVMETACEGYAKPVRTQFEKRKNAATGKLTLIFDGQIYNPVAER